MKSLARAAFLALMAGPAAHAALTELTNVTQLSAGGGHACVLTTAGGVKCWGENLTGQLGDGTTTSRTAAGDVVGLTSGVVAVDASHGWQYPESIPSHSCAIMGSGGVKCWGNNTSGQLGDGTTTQRLTPVDVVGLGGPAVAISTGWHHTCALLNTGAVKCWGLNDSGELGDATTTQRLAPTDVSGLASGVVQISAGPSHTCALTSGGGVKCWGANESGQLGDGTTTQRSIPGDVASLASGVATISAGGSILSPGAFGGGGHTCAITAAGGAKCWGYNGNGQLGDGSTNNHLTPFDVLGLTTGTTDITAGGARVDTVGHSIQTYDIAQTCVRTSSGGAKCWGADFCGTVGAGGGGVCSQVPTTVTTPVDMVGLTSGVVSVSAGGILTCALKSDSSVSCSGEGYGTTAQPVLAGTLPQTITVNPRPPIPVGGTGTVGATGGASGNPVTFASLTPGICSVSGTTVFGRAQGICELAANQAGNAYYEPAPQVTFDFRVGDPVGQTITFGAAPTVLVGTSGTLNATASSGLPVTFASNTPSICSVSGNVVTGVAEGSCTIAASQSGDELYAPAPETLQIFPVGPSSGVYGLTVSKSGSGTGTVTSTPAGIDCGSTCAANFPFQSGASLVAAPATDSVFIGWSGACTGTGACTVSMDAARTVGAQFSLATSIPRVGGISTRGQVNTGDDVIIGGFIIGGSTHKTVVVRARGPSLAGVANPLANPTLQLVSGATVIAANDDWGSAANAGAISASGFAPTNSLESAVLVTLAPGAYTGIVSGVGGGTGVGIVEVYEVDHFEVPLIAISTRGQVLTGESVMIAGFVIQGTGPQTVVVRARGPSLAASGITNALGDPRLDLIRASDQVIIASNDNHSNGGSNFGTFTPSHPLESAIRMTLAPGAYTAIVSGVNGGTGVGIVEVFAQ